MRNPALDAWGGYDRDDPYPLFAQVQADDPVHEVMLADGHRAWLIVRHEEAKAALNHAGLSKDMHAALARDGAVVAAGLPGPAFARHMLSVDPPDHTRLRRLASAAFSRPRIAALRPRVQAIADGLLDDLEASGDTVVDLVKGFAFPLPFTVISELLGVPEPDRDHLGCWFTTLLAPSSAPEPPAEAAAASANIVRYLTGLLARKRAAPGEDLVTDLVRAADQGGALSEQEMLSTIFQLVVAGHDTTTSLIGNGTAALLAHPEQRDAIVADPALIPRAVEEILRWDAPVPHSTFRYTTRDVALGGTVIPAFAQVIICLAAAGRDPARYDHPDKFDVARADTSHVAFGHGIHHCLGARLARLEGLIAFTTLHGRFPAMRLAVPPSALRWGHGDGLVLRGLSELPVILRPRADSPPLDGSALHAGITMMSGLGAAAASHDVRPARLRAGLDLVGLTPLMEVTTGSSEVAIGLIDGPVAASHPGLAAQVVKDIGPGRGVACGHVTSAACMHGTHVAGILAARRGSEAPAICPDCVLLVRPIFLDAATGADGPRAGPEDLAQALTDCTEAGVRVVNVSAALARPSISDERGLTQALDHAARRDVIVVVAAGNQATLASTALTRHPWVIPVVSYDVHGRPQDHCTIGRSIGRSGLGAPGAGITSLGAHGRPVTASGTSVAAPFVTGAAALLCGEFPDASGREIKAALLAARTRRRTTVVPPLMDAWRSHHVLRATRPRRR